MQVNLFFNKLELKSNIIMNNKTWQIIPLSEVLCKSIGSLWGKLRQDIFRPIYAAFKLVRISFLIALFTPSFAVASFNSGDYSPLNQIYGIPFNQSFVKHDTDEQLTISGQLISISTGSSPGTETVLLDGEIYRLDIYGHRKAPQWLSQPLEKANLFNSSLSINIPYIHHGGGFMDSMIDEWHKVFGLPEGNRESRPRDSLLYHYTVDGETLLNFNKETGGIGDLQLSFMTHALPSESGENSIQFRAGLKLPTGDENKLTGSGKHDTFFDIMATMPRLQSAPNLTAQLLVGYSRTLRSGPLESRLKPEHVYGSFHTSYQIHQSIAVAAQVNFHSAFYESQTRQLGKNSLVGTFGLHCEISDSDTIDLFFTEDLSVATTQDFSLGLSWKRSFHQ